MRFRVAIYPFWVVPLRTCWLVGQLKTCNKSETHATSDWCCLLTHIDLNFFNVDTALKLTNRRLFQININKQEIKFIMLIKTMISGSLFNDVK